MNILQIQRAVGEEDIQIDREGREMKYFNKKGDDGYTSLLFGERILKYDKRPDAYGTLDEANSALGMARAFCKNQKTR